MGDTISYWPLVGVLIVVLGLALRFNPMLVVVVAGLVTGLVAGMSFDEILRQLGSSFVSNRTLPIVTVLPLMIVGLLEYYGLREHGRDVIAKIKSATPGRFLIAYLFLREIGAAIGLTSLGGQPNMVRPVIAPMTEGAATTRYGELSDALRYRLRAMAAATDNVGLFFGEDIFVAFGSIALMYNFLSDNKIDTTMQAIALWGIPTAVCAFLIHAFRLWRMDRAIAKAHRVPAAGADGKLAAEAR